MFGEKGAVWLTREFDLPSMSYVSDLTVCEGSEGSKGFQKREGAAECACYSCLVFQLGWVLRTGFCFNLD
jgi:hypothetical protein